MASSELVTPVPAGAADRAVPAPAVDADFEKRWAAWIARGHAHEARTRRKIVTSAGVVGIAAAIAYAFLHA
jgi:hypothetical protein